MRTTMAKEVVHSVLDYFSLYMTFARLRNDLRTVEHFEDCWRLVFVKFFGSYRVPTPSPMVSCQSSADTAPRPRPRWFTEKYSRPVRKVVARTTERVAGLGRGEYFSVAFDVLECGHKKESTSALTGAPPAKHRRCEECAHIHNEMVTTGQHSDPVPQGRLTKCSGDLARGANPISPARRDFVEATV